MRGIRWTVAAVLCGLALVACNGEEPPEEPGEPPGEEPEEPDEDPPEEPDEEPGGEGPGGGAAPGGGGLAGANCPIIPPPTERDPDGQQGLVRIIADAIDEALRERKGCPGAFGDPHLRTHDGLTFSFQAAGEFRLVEGPGIQIQARFEPVAGYTTVSRTTAVAVEVGGSVVEVALPADAPVLVDGEPLATDLFEPEGGGVIALFTEAVVVVWPDGTGAMRVDNRGDEGSSVRRNLDVKVVLGSDVEGQVRGLLGDHDGDARNDLVDTAGDVLALTCSGWCSDDHDTVHGRLAPSWQVTAQTSLFTYPPGGGPDDFLVPGFPERVTSVDTRAAEEDCWRAGVFQTDAVQACLLDVALTGDAAWALSAAEAQILPQLSTSDRCEPRVGGSAGLERGDPARRGAGTGTAATAEELWRAADPDTGQAVAVDAVAIGDDAVAVAVARTIRLLDAQDGTVRWSAEVDERVRSVTLTDEVVLVAEPGRLVAFDRQDGSTCFAVPMPGLTARSVAPTGEALVVTAIVDNGPLTVVLMVDLAGDAAGLRWLEVTGRSNPVGQLGISTAIVGDGAVVLDDRSTLTARDLTTGEELWRADALARPADHPGAIADGVVYAADQALGVVALDLATGEELWRGEREGREGASGGLAVGPEQVVSAGDGELRAHARSDGRRLWQLDLDGRARSAPVISGDTVVVVDDGGVRFVAVGDGAPRAQIALDGAFDGTLHVSPGGTVAYLDRGRQLVLLESG